MRQWMWWTLTLPSSPSPSGTSRCRRMPGYAFSPRMATVRTGGNRPVRSGLPGCVQLGHHSVPSGDPGVLCGDQGPLDARRRRRLEHHRDPARPAERVLPVHLPDAVRGFSHDLCGPHVRSEQRLDCRRHQHHPVRHAGFGAAEPRRVDGQGGTGRREAGPGFRLVRVRSAPPGGTHRGQGRPHADRRLRPWRSCGRCEGTDYSHKRHKRHRVRGKTKG